MQSWLYIFYQDARKEGEEMSNDYDTDELVRWIEGIAPVYDENSPSFTIIQRLLLGDVLCAAAKQAVRNHYTGEALAKAIADYERRLT